MRDQQDRPAQPASCLLQTPPSKPKRSKYVWNVISSARAHCVSHLASGIVQGTGDIVGIYIQHMAITGNTTFLPVKPFFSLYDMGPAASSSLCRQSFSDIRLILDACELPTDTTKLRLSLVPSLSHSGVA